MRITCFIKPVKEKIFVEGIAIITTGKQKITGEIGVAVLPDCPAMAYFALPISGFPIKLGMTNGKRQNPLDIIRTLVLPSCYEKHCPDFSVYPCVSHH